MKKLLLVAAAALAFGGVASAQGMTFPEGALKDGKIDLDSPEGALMAARKVQCSLIDEKPVTYYWFGKAYSRRTGERDRNLFDVEGMNIRQCGTVNDADRGFGYKLVSREILLYLDPDTGEVLKTWTNPWTDEEVEVMHVANDPVNFTSYVTGRDGNPITFSGDVLGDRFQMNSTFPLWYSNPLASDYQAEIGGTYHATEMFNFLGRTDELTDTSEDTTDVAVGWARMSDWLPWMRMNGRDGLIYMHTAGRKLADFDDLSDRMKSEIAMHYPEYTAPPPVSDPRSNVTSWKYYKAVKEGEVELPER
ncbi:MAG: DUF1838 family protein [Pseudomonadota bacterium]